MIIASYTCLSISMICHWKGTYLYCIESANSVQSFLGLHILLYVIHTLAYYFIYSGTKWWIFQHIEAETKWLPFSRRNFKINFIEKNVRITINMSLKSVWYQSFKLSFPMVLFLHHGSQKDWLRGHNDGVEPALRNVAFIEKWNRLFYCRYLLSRSPNVAFWVGTLRVYVIYIKCEWYVYITYGCCGICIYHRVPTTWDKCITHAVMIDWWTLR